MKLAYSVESTPFKTYTFGVRASPEDTIINDFLIEYDFNTNKGNISLIFTPFLADAVNIYFPKEIFVDDILVYNKPDNRQLIEDREYKRYYNETSNEPTNFLRIKKISNPAPPPSPPPFPVFIGKMIISVSGNNFHPNGNFEMNLQQARPQKLYTFLRFDLANYECGINCFIDYNSKLGHFTEGQKLNIHLIEEKNEDNNIGYKWFIINTIDKNKVSMKQRNNNISIALFVSAIVLFINMVIEATNLLIELKIIEKKKSLKKKSKKK